MPYLYVIIIQYYFLVLFHKKVPPIVRNGGIFFSAKNARYYDRGILVGINAIP
jgi:hypothetical protein